MATITTAGNGNWSSTTPNAPWPGGTLPTNADDIVIAQNTTVTLDSITAVALTVSLAVGTVGNVGGILVASTSASSKLTIERGILISGTLVASVGSTRNPTLNLDVSSVPNINCELVLNNGRTTGTGFGVDTTFPLQLKGAARKRWTTVTTGALTGGTTLGCTVADASGWKVGDRLVFICTKAYPSAFAVQSITNVTSDGTFVTLTASSAAVALLAVGRRVVLTALQAEVNGGYYVYDKPTSTTFRIALAGITVTDTAGSFYYLPDTDEVTIATISGNDITWSDGKGASGSVAFDHAANCIVGNFSSNLTVRSSTRGDAAYVKVQNPYATAASQVIQDVCFKWLGGGSAFQTYSSLVVNNGIAGWSSVSNNAFYDFGQITGAGGGLWWSQTVGGSTLTKNNNIFYTNLPSDGASTGTAGSGNFGDENDIVVFSVAQLGAQVGNPGHRLIRPKISGVWQFNNSATYPAVLPSKLGVEIIDGDFWGNGTVIGGYGLSTARFTNCTFGTKYTGAYNDILNYGSVEAQITLVSCPLDTTGRTINGALTTNLTNTSFLFLNNKNGSTSDQEVYTRQSTSVPAKKRDYSTPISYTRSTSSLLHTSTISEAIDTTTDVLAKNGVAATVIAYMVTSHAPSATAYGASTLPSVSLIDLDGSTVLGSATYVDVSTGAVSLSTTAPNTISGAAGNFTGFAAGDSVLVENFATAGNNGTKTIVSVAGDGSSITVAETLTSEGSAANRAVTRWYKATISGTQSSGADGNITLKMTSQSAVAGARAWFSGVPISPFMSRARHYGYLFDETVAVRTSNPTVSASEVTAQAYTGISVAWGSPSPVTISASTTFQNLYDYTQAWACMNVASALPLTGAGVAGNPSLFANANVTINTGKVLNGAGSISMGSYLLTTEFASGAHPAYTYTGGTWSQLTTVPTFSGGTLAMAGEGTYTFTAASSIITFAPTANAVNYVLGGGTFSGTIDLRNTHATRTITIQLPAGTSYTTANNTGGAITVSTPAIYQSVTVSGATAGSRIQIYDNTSATELYNGTPTFPYTWTDSVAAAANRQIRLRVSYCTPSTANIFIDTVIGTCGTTSPSNAVSYLVSPVVDAVYVANLIDGTTITDCSISGTSLHVDINTGAVTWQHIYAFMTYWLSTSGGIRDQYLEMTATDQTHYVFATAHGSFKIKNTSSPTAPLVVTGGNAAPDSGSVVNILDTTGGTIFCIEGTVVPFTTSSQAVNQATVEAGVAAQANAIADALLDRTDAIEVGLTPRKSLRLQSAVLGGKLSGGGTATNVMRNAVADSKPRVTATVDSDGNRTAITTDLT